jgi:hypothetical protein
MSTYNEYLADNLASLADGEYDEMARILNDAANVLRGVTVQPSEMTDEQLATALLAQAERHAVAYDEDWEGPQEAEAARRLRRYAEANRITVQIPFEVYGVVDITTGDLCEMTIAPLQSNAMYMGRGITLQTGDADDPRVDAVLRAMDNESWHGPVVDAIALLPAAIQWRE